MSAVYDKKRLAAALAVNILMAAATVAVVVSYFMGNEGQYHITPMQRFMLFTTDSNILNALSAICIIPAQISVLSGKSTSIPMALRILRYTGTCAVALTFTVVVLFLGPTMGFLEMFAGTSVYMHLAGPVLAFVSFCYLETSEPARLPVTAAGAAPAALYGIVYLVQVVFIGAENGGWMDFYGFNTGGFWYISFFIITGAAFGLSVLIRLVHNRVSIRRGMTANESKIKN